MSRLTKICLLSLLVIVPSLYAANIMEGGSHGAMEVFGVGPEMFSDRGVAWCKAIGAVMGEAVSQFGIVALAAIMLYQNLASKAAIRTVKKDVTDRLILQR